MFLIKSGDGQIIYSEKLIVPVMQSVEYEEYMQGHGSHGRQELIQDRAAGQRSVDTAYPEFGPAELVEEINCNACF